MSHVIDIGALIVQTPEIRGGRPRIPGTGVTAGRIGRPSCDNHPESKAMSRIVKGIYRKGQVRLLETPEGLKKQRWSSRFPTTPLRSRTPPHGKHIDSSF